MHTRLQIQTKPSLIASHAYIPVQNALLFRKCACGGNPGVDGECSACRGKRLSTQRSTTHQSEPLSVPSIGHDFNRIKINSTAPDTVQTKLTVNQPGDKYEQEADRVAEQVMWMPDLASQHLSGPTGQTQEQPILQRTCSTCDELYRQTDKQEGKDEETLHAKEMSGQTPQVTPALQTRISAMRGGGQPLPQTTRSFMEPRFGHDFSQVRIHTNADAAGTAQEVNARAYTVGRDIVFGAGQYAPRTNEGKRLLAHELTHVVQQRGQQTVQMQRQATNTPPQTTWQKQLNEILPQTVGLVADLDRYFILLGMFGERALNGLVNKIYNNKDAQNLVHQYGLIGIEALGDTLSDKGLLDVAKAKKAIEAAPEHYSYSSLALRSEKKTPYERPDRTRFNFCFIMGTQGVYKIADWFAKAYFSGIHEVLHVKSLCGLLEEIKNIAVNKLADDERAKIGQVIIISHADKEGGLYFPMNDNDKNKYITPDDIAKIFTSAWLEKTDISCRFAAREVASAADTYTHIIVKGCNLGQNQAAIDALRQLFGGQVTVTAPKYKVELRALGYGRREKERRTPNEVISWMVKNGYLPPEAEEWAENKKKDFVLSLFLHNAKVSGIPADFLIIDGEEVPPSNPRYRENLAESKPAKGETTQ